MTRSESNAEWIESFCLIPEGKYVGQPVTLTTHQRDWLTRIYDEDTRRVIISMARKNAKTAFSAFLLLLHLCGPEAKRNSQLYSAAQSREQAGILFSLAAKMVRMSPTLSDYIRIRDSEKQLICDELGSHYKALSADASTAYGLSPSFVVHDELGQVKGERSELYEALETASGAQEDPLSIVISTQAPTSAAMLSKLIDKAQDGELPRTQLVFYAADEDADPFSEEAIKQANPHWDDLINKQEIFDMAAEAQGMKSKEASYRNLILNQRVNASNPFVSRGVWEQNSAPPAYEVFDGGVFMGLDLSARNDLTAAVAIKFHDKQWHVWPTFFVPETGIRERAERDRVPYDMWAEQGYLELTPGSSVSYEYVARWLADFCADHGVDVVRFDRWRIDVLQAELARLGAELPMEGFGQGYRSMAPALDELESELMEGRLCHGNHPVLNMCAANAVAQMDPAGNRKLAKDKSTGRIDGMVALAMALHGAAEHIPQRGKMQLFTLG